MTYLNYPQYVTGIITVFCVAVVGKYAAGISFIGPNSSQNRENHKTISSKGQKTSKKS